jgi:glycosyltransferase involved in cell wall biosynthesis
VRVGIATVQVPFISGGAEVLAGNLKGELERRGHRAEIISMPFKWYPPAKILDMMAAARLLDLTEVNGERIDKLVTLKFPMYFTDHPDKTGWILHQHRQAYELFGTPYGDLHHDDEGRLVAAEIRRWDEALLPAHRHLYTLSKTVSERLARNVGLASTPLYHPPLGEERYRHEAQEDFILYPGRFDPIKRQHLLVEAMRHAPKSLKLVLIGPWDSHYGRQVAASIETLGLSDRVDLRGPVSEEEKLSLYGRCLAAYNGVFDEDYGYVTLEAFSAEKPVVIHPDAGGPLEFVADGTDSLVVPPDAKALGEAFGWLHAHRARARQMGAAGKRSLAAKNVTWDHVVESLLA